MTNPVSQSPDTAALAGWLDSWMRPDGAIHGYHNHTVWGSHPFLVGDDWCGHSTFAAPLLTALAEAVACGAGAKTRERLEAAIRFQCGSRQEDGQFAHIGFQIGERVKTGLVHTVVPAAALCGAVAVAGDALPGDCADDVERVVREVLEVSAQIYGGGVSERTVANQEYIRLWARIAHMETFGHGDWNEGVLSDLDTLIKHFHVPGLPDSESFGCLRSQQRPDRLEPAEYYGLMIHPLVRAAKLFGEERYLEAARRLARHIVRSAWEDAAGRKRVHRSWGRFGGRWERTRRPMLVGGIGLTLDAIRSLAVASGGDDEFERFLTAMDATYAAFQHPAGFFLAAEGWDREMDVIPSSAWQSHDLLYLIRRYGLPEGWDAAMASGADPRVAVVLGWHCVWLENGAQWLLTGTEQMNCMSLRGRKDRERFEPDLSPWVAGKPINPAMRLGEAPRFFETDDRIVHASGREDLAILNASGLPYDGPGQCVDVGRPR